MPIFLANIEILRCAVLHALFTFGQLAAAMAAAPTATPAAAPIIIKLKDLIEFTSQYNSIISKKCVLMYRRQSFDT